MENNLSSFPIEEEINFIDYLNVIYKYRKVLISIFFFTTFLTFVVSLSMPKIYEAFTTILPPTKNQGNLLSKVLSQSSFGNLASLSGIGDSKDHHISILKSRNIAERIIKKYGLIDYFKLKSKEEAKNMEVAVITLKNATSINQEKEGLIVVKVQLKNPELASDIANAYIQELQNYLQNSSLSIQKTNRIFIKEQLDKTLENLKQAEDSLRGFQEKNKTISLNTEIEEAIKAAAELKAHIATIEVQLGVMKSYVSTDHPEFEKKQLEIVQLKKQLSQMEFGNGNPHYYKKNISESGLTIIPFKELPAVGLNLMRLKRNVMIQEMIYKLLQEEYEKAKILEASEVTKIEILDKAIPPTKKIKPKIKLNVLLSGFLSIFMGIFLAFFLEYLEKQGINISNITLLFRKEVR
ncbi:MAG: GNVR domain-containing protein [bacterium]|nr:GNVR domain-containing protein [bacterium]